MKNSVRNDIEHGEKPALQTKTNSKLKWEGFVVFVVTKKEREEMFPVVACSSYAMCADGRNMR